MLNRSVTFTSQYDGEWTRRPVLLGRLRRMMASTNVTIGRYNLGRPPRENRDWSQAVPDSPREYLTVAGVPVRFWVVGEVAHDGVSLVGMRGEPLPMPSLTIRPIYQGEYRMWTSFVRSLGHIYSPGLEATSGSLTTGRSMVVSGGKIMPFTECYDATTTLAQYPTMPEWPAAFVGQNDLVVAEVRIIRHLIDDTYIIDTELRAVSMLYKAPQGMLFDGVYDGGEDNEVF